MALALWSNSDVETLIQLNKEGVPNVLIGERLGRTQKAVAEKLAYISLSPDQRAHRRTLLRQRRLAGNKESKRLHPNGPVIEAERPSLDLLQERQIRAAAPLRDLTALYMGDPPVGYSALERRV